MKKIIKLIMKYFGYEITKIKKSEEKSSPYTTLINDKNIIDLEVLSSISLTIPGMINPHSGQFLYVLCYLQQLQGDVVEIGSWLGRSSSFLARAVKESNNGTFYAIDHFQGNIGKEKLYTKQIKQKDIKKKYLENIERLGLLEFVTLLDMKNDQAAKYIESKIIRFLFIDGEHTKEGVQKDIELFSPKLVKGSIIVFDDFSTNFPGVVDVAKSLYKKMKINKSFAYENTLVIIL